MKLHKKILLLSVLLFAMALPAWAQVEMAAMRTVGIECGVCAAVTEVGLLRIEGVDKVTISRSNESVMIAYSPDARFQPEEIRKVLAPLFVDIKLFQVRARGRVEDQGGKRFFVSGENLFVLATPAGNAPRVSSNAPVVIEAVLNDQLDPMELTVLTVKTVAP
jgi:hypothetical protein